MHGTVEGKQRAILPTPQAQLVAPDAAGIQRPHLRPAALAEQGGPVAKHQKGLASVRLAQLEPGPQAIGMSYNFV